MGSSPRTIGSSFRCFFKMSNIRGALVMMPHKVTTTELVDELTPIALVAGASNAVLVCTDGSLLGDQFDGAGFARGVARKGFDATGKSALVVGNGGVGSLIAASLVDAGLSRIGLFDRFIKASDALAERLNKHYPDVEVTIGSKDPEGYDLVVNATPLGMKDDDPMPIEADRIAPSTFVADVVMKQTITPFLQAAIDKGCQIQIGKEHALRADSGLSGVLRFRVDDPDELRAVSQIPD
jgi:shikimate dehydrogenase